MTHTCTYSNFMLIPISRRSYNNLLLVQISRRSYRAYSYSEVLVGITDQNDTHLFTLIPHSCYYHITMEIPRPVLIND